MVQTDLRERLLGGILFIDGAMGTQLLRHGVRPGVCNEYLNIESPDIVAQVHQSYVRSGSQAVVTNTFGANRLALARHGVADETAKINEAGAKIAHQAVGDSAYVFGNIGPTGDFLEPFGSLTAGRLDEVFSEQARALIAGGVDGFIIETMAAVEEARIAVEAVKSLSEHPVLLSLAFDATDHDFRTMMGVGVEGAVDELASLGIEALGFNCGTASLDQYVQLTGLFAGKLAGSPSSIKILAEPNAGVPALVDGEAVYRVSPSEFADAVMRMHSAGAGVLGGCCGTTPEHIAAVHDRWRKR